MATTNTPTALQTLLSTANTIVSMTAERLNPNANPHAPAFLHGLKYIPSPPGTQSTTWYLTILPFITTLMFRLDSVPDILFASVMLAAPSLPNLHTALTALSFPNFYWFAGVGDARPHNPFCQFAIHLPHLRVLELGLHTAGCTMARTTGGDEDAPQERRAMSSRDVVAKYELQALFGCRELRVLRMRYVECKIVKASCTEGDPVAVLQEMRGWIQEEFGKKGREVRVELLEIETS
ncbi:hypothetical protein IQ07DRAFT_630407 [Pyrenochaeta sp. DS3sAY3a]|nr:hypothetical protein IQ07DRAFT_630407 [Pyrenochaeta sp. DS3sAY3a]